MPSGGTRSRNGSCCGGSARCTASTTLSYCCGPVTASTSGIALGDRLGLGAHAAGDDDLAVLRQRLADRRERFRLRAVEEPAGVDDGEVGAVVLAGELVALRAQPRDDALGIDQRLGAAERDEAHLRSADVRSIWAQELIAGRDKSKPIGHKARPKAARGAPMKAVIYPFRSDDAIMQPRRGFPGAGMGGRRLARGTRARDRRRRDPGDQQPGLHAGLWRGAAEQRAQAALDVLHARPGSSAGLPWASRTA